MKKVTKDEFDRFVVDYPTPLRHTFITFTEPPIKEYHDPSIGKPWPDSRVAFEVMHTSMQGHSAYHGEADEYFILE